jgi:hypothetical protein
MMQGDALAVLFPGHDPEKWTVETDWEPWKKPEPSLQIDDKIDELRKKEKGAKLEDRKLLEDRGITCPYLYARMAIARAILFAHASIETETAIRRWLGDLERRKAETEALASNLSRFVHKNMYDDFSSILDRGTALPDIVKYNETIAQSREALQKCIEAVEGLKSLARIAEDELRRLPSQDKKAKEWAKSFAEVLGFAWANLTTENRESASYEFAEFVKSAYISLGGRDKIISWENQTRLAFDRINERQRFNQLDRDKLKIPAPGDEVIRYKEYQEFQMKLSERFESNVKGIEEISRTSGHPAQKLARKVLDKRAQSADYIRLVELFIAYLDLLKTEKSAH